MKFGQILVWHSGKNDQIVSQVLEFFVRYEEVIRKTLFLLRIKGFLIQIKEWILELDFDSKPLFKLDHRIFLYLDLFLKLDKQKQKKICWSELRRKGA